MHRLFDDLVWPEGPKGSTDRLVMELLYHTGMRLAELLGLRVGDADLQEGTLRVMGKRQKERVLPIGPSLVKSIQDHWDQGL